MNSHFFERTVCPLCEKLEPQVRTSFPEIAVLQCSSCGFLFSSQVMQAHKLTACYAQNYVGDRQKEGNESTLAQTSRS
jgi:hypothetical protein